jgi:hypothetical protein
LIDRPTMTGRRLYRLTPKSLEAGRAGGMLLGTLEVWFQQRAGQPLPAAARLLMAGDQTPPLRFARHLVLHVPNAETADGLTQWPETRDLIATRLGPTALAVMEENAEELRRRLKAVGLALTE